jgi:hypothetical protein
VQTTFAHLGTSAAELIAGVESVALLLQETVELANGLYQPRYTFAK